MCARRRCCRRVRTPRPISDLAKTQPEITRRFSAIAELLENHYKDMQDIEFTIEEGRLFVLQTRNGKRTAKTAVQIAIDLVSGRKDHEEKRHCID